MIENFCSYQSQTAEAQRTGNWPEKLSRHVAECSACNETRAVAGFMLRSAEEFGRRELAPDPTMLWVKARLAKQLDDERDSRFRLWSLGLSGLAATLTVWAAIRWIPPVLMQHADTLATAGLSIALTIAILYFAAYKPLKNANH